MKSSLGSPVWIGDSKVAVASDSSIDKATVVLDKGEMSFGIFDFDTELDQIVLGAQTDIATLHALRTKLGNDALPQFLTDYIGAVMAGGGGTLAVHTASSIAGYGDNANQTAISRDKGLLGNPQLELKKFPTAAHHVKIFFNAENRARVFYKYRGSLQFIQNLNTAVT